MIVFGRESIKHTAGEIKQNVGLSPAYAYLAGINFTRAAFLDIAALALSGFAQSVDPHFAHAMSVMHPGTMPSLTPAETAVAFGTTALAFTGGVSGLAGIFRGAESIATAPGQIGRRRRQQPTSTNTS